jgi:hemerythrin
METIAIDWSKIYETGHPVVDGQHRKLFKLINELNIALSVEDSKLRITDSIDQLSAYVETHFKTEEDLMKSTSYPDYIAHKQEHDNLKEQSEKLIKLFGFGKVDLTATISKFLSDWLKHHIQGIDKKMIDWLKQHESAE